ncbi:hypothetical protein FRC08_004123 [Ceratobasidium sp. 394]|nr:hypothetical protein FRC08_004123 [Ceratobasidium sp. 394]
MLLFRSNLAALFACIAISTVCALPAGTPTRAECRKNVDEVCGKISDPQARHGCVMGGYMSCNGFPDKSPRALSNRDEHPPTTKDECIKQLTKTCEALGGGAEIDRYVYELRTPGLRTFARSACLSLVLRVIHLRSRAFLGLY